MIHGLDSSMPPNAQQVAVAHANGFDLWSGYLASHPAVNLLHPWARADFDIARAAGSTPIAFCSGVDDPVALRALAAAWNVRLCLDVENGIRGDGPWVQAWLDASGAGLYGNAGVHPGRRAAFHVLAAYPGGQPVATWDDALTPRPAGPCAWQSCGTHSLFGVGVDSGYYDDWFGASTTPQGDDMARLVNTPANGIWLQDGRLYVHVDTPASAGALLGAGVASMAGQITQVMHDTLVAACGADASAVGVMQADLDAHLDKIAAGVQSVDQSVDRIAPPDRQGGAA